MGQGLLSRVAAAVGTPTFVYDLAAIRRQYGALDAALGPVAHRIYYSVKANSNLAVLSFLRSLGAGADIVSAGELERVLRAGFQAAEVVFSGVGKTPQEIESAIRAGVSLINLESAAELDIVAATAERVAKGAPVSIGIRVNPDVTTRTHPYTQTGGKGMKFGIPMDEVLAVARRAAERKAVTLRSVGMHIGSQIAESGPYREGAHKLARIVDQFRIEGIDSLHSVDVGGGLGISYTGDPGLNPEAFAKAVSFLPQQTNLTLLTEPGRFLVGNAGSLLTRVLYRKRSGGRDIVVVDAGMNDLLRPSLYGAHHDIRVLEPRGGDGGDIPVDVVGPLCESGDFLGMDRRLPGAGPGALLEVRGAGAYAFSMSSQYNSRPRAAEVVVEGERYGIARKRETVEDLLRGESSSVSWSET
ncbi:MAG: diaminopimelate decarboxylase [Gemmatimonadetes bacterium]|nr:diaminopimelate decarboxylase [Gemmatimonadota bacterium]